MADQRIPLLLNIPAKVRFVSLEPLLGPVDVMAYALSFDHADNCRNEHCALAGGPDDCAGVVLPGLDWVIVGGESGPRRRDCAGGVNDIRDAAVRAKQAGIPVFVKQDCAAMPGQQGRIPDDVWGWKEFPEVVI